MRKRIFEIIEVSEDNDKYSKIYDAFMMITICISIFPLAFKNQTGLFNAIDKVAAFIFIVDYILRLSTADYKLKKGVISFCDVSVFVYGYCGFAFNFAICNYSK